MYYNYKMEQAVFFIYMFVPFKLILIFLMTLKAVRTYGREEENLKGRSKTLSS